MIHATVFEFQWHDLILLNPICPKWQAKAWTAIRNIAAQMRPEASDLLTRFMKCDQKQPVSARQSLCPCWFAAMGLVRIEF